MPVLLSFATNVFVNTNTNITGQYGNLIISSNGEYTYQLNNTNPTVDALNDGDNLTEVFFYTLDDGSSTSLTITINGANDAPVARDNFAIVSADAQQALTGNILANATDVDNPLGDLKVAQIIFDGTTTNITDQTVEIIGEYGTLSINPDGSYDYTLNNNLNNPGAGQQLPETFSYIITDGNSESEQKNLIITIQGTTVSNEPPQNQIPQSPLTVLEVATLAINDISVTDADGNLETVTLTVENGLLNITLSGDATITDGANGSNTITLSGSEDDINTTLATLSYTPVSGDSDELVVLSEDATGATDRDVISITITSPTLAINSPTVNEGSPYAVFEVNGEVGQGVRLQLERIIATLGEDFGTTLEYWSGIGWTAYTPGSTINIPNNTPSNTEANSNGILFVRTIIINDSEDEGVETFTLKAFNNANDEVTGTATINDDGTGDIFDGNTGLAQSVDPFNLDDDRTLTVNPDKTEVVEGTDTHAQFTIQGNQGQWVKPTLQENSAVLGADYGNLEYFDGTNWISYNSALNDGYIEITDVSGDLQVRTPIVNDQVDRGPRNFDLVVSNTGGDTVDATVNIIDDDLSINTIGEAVNEGSKWALFEVYGATGIDVELNIPNQDGTISGDATTNGFTIEYFVPNVDGTGTWETYNSGVNIDDSGKLLIRVNISSEQDTVNEGQETFILQATNTASGSGTQATATIVDDGTGQIFLFPHEQIDNYNPNTDPDYPDVVLGDFVVVEDRNLLDEDRTLTVTPNQEIVIEGDNVNAVFTVEGTPGQLIRLSTEDGTAEAGKDYEGAIEYSLDGGTNWLTYIPDALIEIPVGGSLQARVGIINNQIVDDDRDFELVATNVGGVDFSGQVTILDDEDSSDLTVSVTGQPTVVNNNNPFPITITFNKDVNGFEENGISITNGTLSDFTPVNGSEYTVTVTPTGGGEITINVPAGVATDSSSNQNSAATPVVVGYDIVPPSVNIISDTANFSNTNPFTATIEFSEEVKDFKLGDIEVSGGTVIALNVDPNDPTRYIATITPDGTNSNITINISESIAQDLAGNDNTASNPFVINFIAPPPPSGGGSNPRPPAPITPPPAVNPPLSVTVNPLTTTDGTPTLTGTTNDRTALITVNINGVEYRATNNGNGTWSLTLDNPLPIGVHDIVATATNARGESVRDRTFNELTITSLCKDVQLIQNEDQQFQVVSRAGINGSEINLRFELMGADAGYVNEVGVVRVNEQNQILDGDGNLISPDDPNYRQEVLRQGSIIFSALGEYDLSGANPFRYMDGYRTGDRFLVYLIQNNTKDNLLYNSADEVILFSVNSLNPEGQETARVTKETNRYSLVSWEDNFDGSFDDLELKVEVVQKSFNLGTQIASLQTQPESEFIDLRNVGGDSLKLLFTAEGDAGDVSILGFYRIDDENGGIFDGNNQLILPTAENKEVYQQLALNNLVQGLEIFQTPSQLNRFTFELETGHLYAPILKQGSVEEGNFNAYFPFIDLNGGVDHVRSLGENIWSFEDLPNGGDLSFDDLIVRAELVGDVLDLTGFNQPSTEVTFTLRQNVFETNVVGLYEVNDSFGNILDPETNTFIAPTAENRDRYLQLVRNNLIENINLFTTNDELITISQELTTGKYYAPVFGQGNDIFVALDNNQVSFTFDGLNANNFGSREYFGFNQWAFSNSVDGQTPDSTNLVFGADLTFNCNKYNLLYESQVLDLTGVGGESADLYFSLTRSADNDSILSFYRVDNLEGGIIDPLTGQIVNPELNNQSRYVELVRERLVDDLNLSVDNNNTADFALSMAAGNLYAPILAVGNSILGALDEGIVFFAFSDLNPNQIDHIRRSGIDTWGFEDMIGGGDLDYNDIVFSAELKSSNLFL